MPRKSKAILGVIVAAIALVALTAVPAFANTVTVNLTVSPLGATYAHDVLVTPSITGTETLPGDAINLEAWDSAESTWTPFGEGLKVEETGTVSPQFVSVDETFLPWYYANAWHPVHFRATYAPVSRAKDESGTAIASPKVMSNEAALTVFKIKSIAIKTSFPKSPKHGYYYTFAADTKTVAGVGTMRYTVYRHGYRTVVVNATSADYGHAAAAIKFAKKGTYKVTAQWMGNAFSPKSKAVSVNVKVR
jgi:hypothetical protein